MLRIMLFAVCTVAGVAWWSKGSSRRALEEREEAWDLRIQAGDLVFQDLDCGERCALIRFVTDSRYSHVGVVVDSDGGRVVWEALRPVGPAPLGEWARRGRGGDVAVYRPKPPLLHLRSRVEAEVFAMVGRPYDGNYQWDEERIYCSELVAKAYEAAGLVLVAPHTVDLGRHERRIAQLSRGVLTSDTLMVTPADLVRSGHFERVVDELRE